MIAAPDAGWRNGSTRQAIRVRLLCFASAGDSAAPYRRWQQFLPDHIEVCPIELPGRGLRWNEPLGDSFRGAVNAILPSVLPLIGPRVAFFGHSLGAFFSYELARLLYARRLTLACHVLLSAARAPHIARREGPLAPLPDDAFLEHIVRLDGVPKPVLDDPSAMSLYLPVLRADARLYDSLDINTRLPLPAPISVFGGDRDPEVTTGDLAAWELHTAAQFRMDIFAGGHFFFRADLPAFVRLIGERLSE